MAQTREEKLSKARENAKRYYYTNIEERRAYQRNYSRKKREETKRKLKELEELKNKYNTEVHTC